MSVIAWVGERFVLVASMAGVATFAGGALGGFLFAYACRALTATEDGGRPQLAETMCGSFLALGTVCLATAVAIGLVMAVDAWRGRSGPDREWAPAEGQRVRAADVPPADGAWLLIPTIILTTTLITSWLAVSPVVGFLAQNLPRSQGLGGVVLMPPGFMLGAIGTLVVADLGMLLLLWACSPVFPGTYAYVALAHLGLIVCSRAVLNAVRSVSGPAGPELPMLQEVEVIVASSAQGLTWSLAARALGLPFLIPAPMRALFRARPPAARLDPRPSPVPGPLVEPTRRTGVPLPAPPIQSAAAAGPMLGRTYALRASFLAWPLVGAMTIDDTENAKTLKARLVPMSPWPTIQVWLETSKERVPIVAMQSRHLLGLRNEFDVRDGLTHELLATVKKPFAGEWLVYSPTGDLMAITTRAHSGLGTAEFIVRMSEHPVASLTWSNVIRPALEIDLSADTERRFDRRLGIALGVIAFVNISLLAR